MTLTDEIRNFTEDAYGRLPTGYIQTFRDLIDGLTRQQFGRKAPRAGETFPDFDLSDHEGKRVRASDIWSRRNLVVKFYRGGWCPYCNLELAALQRLAPRFAEEQTDVVAVAPERPVFQAETKQKAQAGFRFLWDENNALAASLGIAFQVDDRVREVYGKLGLDLDAVNGSWTLPVPATFVVRDGVIRYRYADADYMKREDPLVLLSVLHELNESVRDRFKS